MLAAYHYKGVSHERVFGLLRQQQLLHTIIQPIKNVASEVGDEIESAYDTTVDAVSSAAHSVADSVTSGVKAIGNIIDTSA